ncbi:hypothetical protein [Terrimonas ferruginea]|uniref:hypothetical protein n=1 Tax=Terrimonas ferruginea TaxID=249 RepID=UPI00040C7509|nr:hypothetical protein [Terrimonas ferruginea]
MKKTMFVVLAATTMLLCSFTPSGTASVAKFNKQTVVVGDETFYITTGVGIGAREFILSVERQGNEAGEGNVEFDVDIMYNGSSSQIQSHHVSMYNGQLTLSETRQSSVVIGTDVDPASGPYNLYYY